MRPDCAHLQRDCGHCRALCCVVLPHAREEGFPISKAPGAPCPYLTEGRRCAIHGELSRRGLYGCLSFDCLGAGPAALNKLADAGWREDSGGVGLQIFSQLLVLHRLDWHLHQAFEAAQTPRFHIRILELRSENAMLRALSAPELLTLDSDPHRLRVHAALRQLIAVYCPRPVPAHGDCVGMRFLGRDLRGCDCSSALFQGADLRGCDLTGVSLLGADLRGADLRGADLSHALFLTQGQLNTARGDRTTLLPPELNRPSFWK